MPVEINEITSQVRQAPQGGKLTSEQIRIIADKVMAMLLNDLRIEAERARRVERTSIQPTKGRR